MKNIGKDELLRFCFIISAICNKVKSLISKSRFQKETGLKLNSSEQDTTAPAPSLKMEKYTFGGKDSKMKLRKNQNIYLLRKMEFLIWNLDKGMVFISIKKQNKHFLGETGHLAKLEIIIMILILILIRTTTLMMIRAVVQ